MSETFMIHLQLNSPGLMRLGRMLKLPPNTDNAYLVHCALGELFGRNAPPIFDVASSQDRHVRVLAYSNTDLEALQEIAKGFASPTTYSIPTWDECASKPMPTKFVKGMRFSFEVNVCPVVRLSRDKRGAKKGAEVDAFLSRVWDLEDGEPLERAQVYAEWLGSQLSTRGGAELLEVKMESFQLERMQRRTQGTERKARTIKRPVALMKGVIEVSDTESFHSLLLGGIGRHKAFGFGMLKIRRY